MNKVILTGRLVKDPELKKTQSNISVCRIRLAVDRRFKDKDGNRQTDFLDVIAWRQQAEVISNYMHKGSRIGIVGSIQSRSYEDNGDKRYVQEIIAEEVEFLDSKQTEQKQEAQEEIRPIPPMPKAEAIQATELDDQYLPFDLDGFGNGGDFGELGD